MAVFENKFGTSPIDATKKNALPPYLDLLFQEYGVGGSDVEVLEFALLVDYWIEGIGSFSYFAKKSSNVIDGSSVILLSARGDNYPISGANIVIDSVDIPKNGDPTFTFKATERPIETITAIVLVITSKNTVAARFNTTLDQMNKIYASCVSAQSTAQHYSSVATSAADLAEGYASAADASADAAASDAAYCDEVVTDAVSVLQGQLYPVGSTYITSTNTNPSSILGIGTWELYDKEFIPTKTAENVSSSVTRNTTNASAIDLYCTREGHQIAFTGYLTSAVTISNTNLEMAVSITLSDLGASGFTFSPVLNAQSDSKHAIVLMDMDKSTGRLRTLDVVVRGSSTEIAATSGITFQAVVLCDYTEMVDAKCNKFYWRRTQ